MPKAGCDEASAGHACAWCNFALAVLEVPKCIRAAIAFSHRVVSWRSRAAISSLPGSQQRTKLWVDPFHRGILNRSSQRETKRTRTLDLTADGKGLTQILREQNLTPR